MIEPPTYLPSPTRFLAQLIQPAFNKQCKPQVRFPAQWQARADLSQNGRGRVSRGAGGEEEVRGLHLETIAKGAAKGGGEGLVGEEGAGQGAGIADWSMGEGSEGG